MAVHHSPTRWSRRRFIGGALTGGLTTAWWATGCSTGAPKATPQLVGLYDTDHVIAAGSIQRIPFAVVADGAIELPDRPELPVTVSLDGVDLEHTTVTGRIVDHDHADGASALDHNHSELLRYFALRAELPDPGIYDIRVDFGDGMTSSLAVQAFDPATVSVVRPGQPMPAVTTPTTTDPAGVDPICTRFDGPCPFHDLTVGEALDSERSLAVLVATPAYCQTAYCGPVLDTLIAAAPEFPTVRMIHLEVYANPTAVDGGYADPDIRPAPAMTELHLDFEPSLFLVVDGIVVDRIDNLFDADELHAALAAIA
ncbi:MAG: hypothetical protein ACK5PP_02230 [Acidimicrobiales bacterium]